MDWKLAKSLYIIVFLFINIFLIIIYINAREDPGTAGTETAGILDDTDIDMSVINDMEYEPVEMSVLTAVVENFTQSDEEISVDEIENSSQIKREFQEEDAPEMNFNALQQYKNEEVFRGSIYTYDEVMSTDTQKIFNQTYNDFPVFNHEAARLLFSGDTEADTFEQTILEDIEPDAYTLPVDAKSPKRAVEELYRQERISEEAVILSARLGYFVIFVEEDQVMLRPKWEFHVDDQNVSKTIYVDATSDTEEIIESE